MSTENNRDRCGVLGKGTRGKRAKHAWRQTQLGTKAPRISLKVWARGIAENGNEEVSNWLMAKLIGNG